jgi:signal transduction histidine kinase
MKTSAFLVRVGICFLLSLIPVSELENQLYSARMHFRGDRTSSTSVVIFYVDSDTFQSRGALENLKAKLTRKYGLSYSWEATPNGILTDSDGFTRRSSLLSKKGEPSTSYKAILEMAGKPDQLSVVLPKNLNEVRWINFRGPEGSFPICKQTTNAAPPCDDLKNKWVVFAEESEPTSLLRTPFGEMDLGEVVANDLYTLLEHHPIYVASFIERSLLSLSMILVSAFFIIYYPVIFSAAAVVSMGLTIVLILFQLVFYLFDIYIPSLNIAGSLLITYLIFTGYRLAFQENLQWRTLKQAQYLRELNQMKANFLSLVSHDLKTPLAKIQAVVDRLRKEQQLPASDRSDWLELLESIENSNNELKHYITSILNLSKIESQKVILNKKSNDINRIIQQTLRRLQPLAQNRNITVEEHLEPLFSVECDEDLMRQVLTNLIDNAIKYSPAGSKVLVRSKEEEGFIRIEIEDFGPGIPKDQLPLMFRKFNRFLRPMSEQVKGTGLGLYLSKYFIELHGGSISLKTEEGKGTVFTFTLPLNGVESETLLG